jgi:hypothetical protein
MPTIQCCSRAVEQEQAALVHMQLAGDVARSVVYGADHQSDGARDQLVGRRTVQRADATKVMYWITVTNLTAAPVAASYGAKL